MPKAILELEMPKNCKNCPLTYYLDYHERNYPWEDYACIMTGKGIADKGRRPDCPLKVNEQSNDVEQRLAKGGVAFVVACDKTGMLKYATSLVRKMFNTEEDACVLCGSYVPEGRMVCSVCEKW